MSRRLVKGYTCGKATVQLYGAQYCAPDREKAAPEGGFCNWIACPALHQRSLTPDVDGEE